MSVVTVRLTGGLGNQLFQYAIGRSIAARKGSRLRLDRSCIHLEPHRRYAMGPLSIDAENAWHWHHPRRVYEDPPLDDKFIRARFRCEPRRDRTFTFDPTVFDVPPSVYLIGYWQCERYFLDVADELRAQFRPRRLGVRAGELADEIARTERAVSVHVRRGDLVSNALTNRRHGVCSAGYFAAASRIVAERVGDATYFVFSDDPEWCRENLDLPGTVRLVAGEVPAHEDLHLMSLCDHFVMSNSSFSWWGGWLGESAETVVVAPEEWFVELDFDYSDIAPERWLRIPAR